MSEKIGFTQKTLYLIGRYKSAAEVPPLLFEDAQGSYNNAYYDWVKEIFKDMGSNFDIPYNDLVAKYNGGKGTVYIYFYPYHFGEYAQLPVNLEVVYYLEKPIKSVSQRNTLIDEIENNLTGDAYVDSLDIENEKTDLHSDKIPI